MNMKKGMGIAALAAALLIGGPASSAQAHAPAGEAYFTTYSENALCTYPCSGYYSNHFDAYGYFSNYPAGYYLDHMHATLVKQNQGYLDRWEAYLANVQSSGSTVYNSYLHQGHAHYEDYSSFLEEWNPGVYVTSGNNVIRFYFKYALASRTGGTGETWYPTRYRQNFPNY